MFSTQDHLFTFTQLAEKASEWQCTVWMAALDYKKAFDTVEHESLWAALREQKVSQGYITLLHELYSEQRGNVRTDTVSKEFDICRGPKQGDPLSSLMFNRKRRNRILGCHCIDLLYRLYFYIIYFKNVTTFIAN